MRVSISKLKSFKACRRKYKLHYIEGLTPVVTAPALETGSNYHKQIELLNTNMQAFLEQGDFSKEHAMALAYKKYVLPKVKIVEPEKWLNYDLGNGDELVGIVDGIADDGLIVEHKTTGEDNLEKYEYGLQWDEQILAYMLMTGKRVVHYTVIKKPTIRIKKDETEEDFFARMVAWYDEDTENKIRVLELTRTDEEVGEFKLQLLHDVRMMKEAQQDRDFYRNTCNCNLYNRRCEYSSVCLNYNPEQEYIEFMKGDVEYEPEQN